MAHWSTTLQQGWLTRTTSGTITTVRWEPPVSQRPQVDEGLLISNTDTRYLSRLVMDLSTSPPRLVMFFTVDQSGGIGQGGAADLSTTWEQNPNIRVEYGDLTWDLPSGVVEDTTEQYIYSIPTADQAAFSAFVQGLTDDIDSTLTLWDGQGTNPFAEFQLDLPLSATTDTTDPYMWETDDTTAPDVIVAFAQLQDKTNVEMDLILRNGTDSQQLTMPGQSYAASSGSVSWTPRPRLSINNPFIRSADQPAYLDRMQLFSNGTARIDLTTDATSGGGRADFNGQMESNGLVRLEAETLPESGLASKIYIGTQQITKMYVGSRRVDRQYIGNTRIF